MTYPTSRLPALLAAGLAAGAHLAAAPSPPPAGESDIEPPAAVYKVDPVHPQELYARAVEGEAIVIAPVDMFGNVEEPFVAQATHDEFGMAALLAASEWIFEPATKNGVPIAVKVKIPFSFKIALEHKLNVELGRKAFQEIDAPVTPSFELDQTPLPSFVPAFDEFYPEELENTGKTSAVSLEFIIDPEGYVLNPRIISISTAGFEEAALRAVAHMRYQPVRVDGQPAYISTTMPIQFSAKK